MKKQAIPGGPSALGGDARPPSAHGAFAACAAAALIAAGCASPATGRSRDAHLLWGSAPEARRVTEVRKAGPFWEKVETADGATRESWRPLVHTRIDAAEPGVSLSEWLWPLWSRSERAGQDSWRMLVFSGMTKDETGRTSPQDRTWLFPLWFSGTSKAGEDYAALFPVGGTIREMYYDKISFALFPAWVSWERNGNRTWSVLWPVVQRQVGPRRDALRVFPLWGRSRFEEHYDASFFLWPFWTQAEHAGLSPGREWMLWPLVGRADRANESAWYFLPPFFSHARGRGKTPEYRKTWAPWPLVLADDDKDRHRRRFFPFWAKRWRTDGKAEARIVMWPFWSDRASTTSSHRLREHSFFPVWHDSTLERPDPAAPGGYALEERYARVWPLWSRRYDPDRRFVRIPDLSFQKREGPLERNLLDVFTLYTRGENTGAAGEPRRVDHEALWGLFQSGGGDGGYSSFRLWPLWESRREDGKWRWSLLCGLLGRSGADVPDGSGDEPAAAGQGSARPTWKVFWFF